MEGQWNGQLLWAGKAGVEIFDQEYAAGIDQVETGKRTSGKIRLALEVDDIKESLRKAIEYGATLVHEPVQTPWGDLNARIQSPDGMQITLFQSQKNLQSKKEKKISSGAAHRSTVCCRLYHFNGRYRVPLFQDENQKIECASIV